jgi:hypothetical protein
MKEPHKKAVATILTSSLALGALAEHGSGNGDHRVRFTEEHPDTLRIHTVKNRKDEAPLRDLHGVFGIVAAARTSPAVFASCAGIAPESCGLSFGAAPAACGNHARPPSHRSLGRTSHRN